MSDRAVPTGPLDPAVSRRPDVDWLRVLATYLLFAFHAAKVFDARPYYHVKNAALSEGLGFFTGFVHLWHMPLFFLLAGWAALGSLRIRPTASFLRERVGRLFVPLVFGTIVFGPFLRWAELRTGQFWTQGGVPVPADPNVRFLDYLPRYFTEPGQPTWAHLWFLAYLLTFTLLAAPLLARVARRPPASLRPGRWLVYLPIVPLAVVQLTLRERWPGFQNLVDDWANFSYYLLFFLFGAALAHAPHAERAVQAEAGTAGTATIVAALGVAFADEAHAQGVPYARGAMLALWAVASWCGVVACLGLAARRLSFSNGALRWLAASAFPVYVLHQIGIVAVALVVIGLPLGIPAKLLLTIAGAVALTLAAYQVVVRPLPPLQLLLGMKARRARPRAAGAAALEGGVQPAS